MDNFRKRLDSWQGIHDEPPAGDTELRDTAAVIADEQSDANPYTPPLPVPLTPTPIERPAGMRGESSEVWLVNHPTTLPGLGNLVGGGQAEKGSQFPINSIRVDNLTTQWIYFPEIGAWVPPFWYGRVLRYDGSKVQRVRFETPTGITANPSATTDIARVVFSNEYWPEQSGASITASVAPTTSGAPLTGVVIFDDLSGLPAEVQTAADALALQAGLVTNSFLYGLNGTGTFDRLQSGRGDALSGVGLLNIIPMALRGDATNFDRMRTIEGLGDAVTGRGVTAIGNYLWNGATADRARVPNVFKQVASVVVNAGSFTTVWTPVTTGKKVRLMGWVMSAASALTGDASATFFETNTSGTFMGETGFMSGTEPPYSAMYGPGGPLTSINSAVVVAFSSTAVTLRGVLFGTEE